MHGSEQRTEAFVTPGLMYRSNKYFQIGMAGQFPLNATTRHEFDNDKLIFRIGILCVMTSLASAHGAVGARKFVEPFVTEDANPKDEFVIAKPSFLNLAEGNALSTASLLEKRLSHDLSIALENTWIAHRRGGEKRISFGKIEKRGKGFSGNLQLLNRRLSLEKNMLATA